MIFIPGLFQGELYHSFTGILLRKNPLDVGLLGYEEEDAEDKKLEKEYLLLIKERGKLYPYRLLFWPVAF